MKRFKLIVKALLCVALVSGLSGCMMPPFGGHGGPHFFMAP